MKILKLVAVLAIMIVVSCKKDNNEEITNALVGHWHILNFEPDSSSEMSLLAKGSITELIEAECFPLEYSFSSDGKVSHINKMSFLDPVQGENGVEVECFFEDVFKNGTFRINNDVLTLEYDNETNVYNTTLTNDTLTILQGNFILKGQRISGKMIFSREEF